jgi:hydroxylamine reductase
LGVYGSFGGSCRPISSLTGIAAYADHAAVLGFQKEEVNDFMMEALASTTKTLSMDEMVASVMKAGQTAAMMAGN